MTEFSRGKCLSKKNSLHPCTKNAVNLSKQAYLIHLRRDLKLIDLSFNVSMIDQYANDDKRHSVLYKIQETLLNS